MKVSDTTSQAYLQALKDVAFEFEHTPSPRGQKTREVLDYSFRVLKPTMEPIKTLDAKRNEIIASYTKKEFELYDSGTNKVADFAKASKFWNHLANPDGTVNSAYGHLIWKNRSHGHRFEHSEKVKDVMRCEDDGIYEFEEANQIIKDSAAEFKRTPWDWAKMCLIEDMDTRQAILRFSLPEHQWKGNKDQTCTLHGNFLIRDNKLNLSITMRSNDLMKGLVFDLPWFVSLMYKMREELLETYPDLEIGHYTHHVHSMHLYEKDLEAIHLMCGIKIKHLHLTEMAITTGNVSITKAVFEMIIKQEFIVKVIISPKEFIFIDYKNLNHRIYRHTEKYVLVRYT